MDFDLVVLGLLSMGLAFWLGHKVGWDRGRARLLEELQRGGRQARKRETRRLEHKKKGDERRASFVDAVGDPVCSAGPYTDRSIEGLTRFGP